MFVCTEFRASAVKYGDVWPGVGGVLAVDGQRRDVEYYGLVALGRLGRFEVAAIWLSAIEKRTQRALPEAEH